MTSQRPAATVYGRGGVDVREPRHGLHPAVLALVVVAAITVVLALGYRAVRRSPEDARPAAAPGAAAAPVATPTAAVTERSSAPPSSAAASPTPTAVATFGTGRMRIGLAGDPSVGLGADGDFAAMSSGDTMVVTVIRGLADSGCFTLRAENGRYLRHFNFRLRFDTLDDSDLFRKDATFCPADARQAGTVRLRSKNYPDRLLHRRDSQLYIDKPDGSGAFTRDSSFVVRAVAGR